METPVVLIIFNRPNTTRQVFDEIARAKPKKLFVLADGPRHGRPEDLEKCSATRKVVDRLSWDCEVCRIYSDENLGVGKRVLSGLNEVFQEVDRAIIFEDDCVPHQTFFQFCEELLDRYNDDQRVMHISGRLAPTRYKAPSLYSYYFSYSLNCWGWATWARAWKLFDYEIKLYRQLRTTNWLVDVLGHRRIADFMYNIFESFYDKAANVSAWDQKWNFAVWSQHGLGIRPYVNLIHYAGFEDDPTHSFWADKKHYDLPTEKMIFPLQHPPYMIRDKQADLLTYDYFFSAHPRIPLHLRYPIYSRLRKKLSVIVPNRALDILAKRR